MIMYPTCGMKVFSLLLIIPIISAGPLTFPYTEQTRSFNVTWRIPKPTLSEVSLNLSRAGYLNDTRKPFNASMAAIYEYQAPPSNNTDLFDVSKATLVSNVSLLDATYSSVKSDDTILFTTTLSNGASFDMEFIFSPVERNYSIPRGSNSSCTNSCRCAAVNTVIGGSVKFSFRVSGWPWVSNMNPELKTYLALPLQLQLSPESSLALILPGAFTYPVCDMLRISYVPTLTNNTIALDFNRWAVADDDVPVFVMTYLYFNLSNYDPKVGITADFWQVVPQFNDSIFYDPNISLLLGDLDERSTPSGGGTTGGGAGSNSNDNNNDDNKALSIGLSVGLIGGLCLLVGLCIVIALAVIAALRWNRSHYTGAARV